MAAMDFPANPTNGQVYGNYIYSTATGAWNAKPLTGQKTVVSATAPATPSLGDEWFNSNDGNLYVYYTDVDGSQWVQVKSDATLSSTLGSRVTTLETYPSGLVPVIPTSITTGSGSATIGANGLVTFTGASSVSLNGLFTSTYKNYKIVANIDGTSSVSEIRTLLRRSGTDVTTSYNQGGTELRVNTTTGGYSGSSLNYIGLGSAAAAASSSWNSFELTLMNPRNADVKPYTAISTGYVSGVSPAFYTLGGANTNAGACDGITVLPSAGTFLGTIQVYGYR